MSAGLQVFLCRYVLLRYMLLVCAPFDIVALAVVSGRAILVPLLASFRPTRPTNQASALIPSPPSLPPPRR